MNDSWFREVVSRNLSKGVLIDSNLLLVLLIGICNPALFRRFDRTSAYDGEAFRLLAAFVGQFRKVITTPNILTEVSNLSGGLKGTDLDGLRMVFAVQVKIFDETYVDSRTAVSDRHFKKLGLTDAAIISAALSGKCLVLTADAQLSSVLAARNVDVINFNWIRQYAWSRKGQGVL